MNQITITIPLPPDATHPNKRAHWSKRAIAINRQKGDAHLACRAAMNETDPDSLPWPSASILATFHRPGPNCRPSDPDNLIAWLKASADGLQAAWLVTNDRGLIWLPPVELIGKSATERKVVLVVTKIG